MSSRKTLVVVPVYNRASIVQQTLDSIARQTLLPDMVVVVDDGSTDNTLAVVQAWLSSHPDVKVRILKSSNQGAAKARNLAVSSITDNDDIEFVAFLDSDDHWPEDFLARSVQALAQDTDAVATSTDRDFVYVDSAQSKLQSLQELSDRPLLWLFRNDAGIGSCSLFRFRQFVNAGAYPSHIPTGHDVVIFGKLAMSGKWLHLPGQPTRFSRSSSPAGNKQHGGHLHQRYPDYLTWWAKAFHELWAMSPPDVQTLPEIRRILGKRWRHAGRNALARQALQEAQYCLRHATKLQPWSPKIRALQLKLSFLQMGSRNVA